MRMQRGGSEPGFVAGLQVQINNRCKAEGEKSAWDLPAICIPELGMCVDRVIIEGCRVPYMHMGIDQTGYQVSSRRVEQLRIRAGNQPCADFGNPAIFDQHVRVPLRSGTLRRNQRYVLNKDGL